MPSWKKVLISGSDAALNTLNVTTALTASGLIYPTVDGTNGQAIVTDGSGSLSFATIISGTGATTKLNQSIAAMTWSFAHNLNEQYPVVTIYDSNDEVIVPEKIDAVDANNLAIYFSTARIGRAVAVVGGTTVSASLAQTASYVEFNNVVNKPTLISSSIQIETDITGSFTSLSASIAGDIEDIVDGTTTVTSASHAEYAESSSFATYFNISQALTASGLLYPTIDGTVGQVITTDGAGNLSFLNVDNTRISIKNVSGGEIAKGTPLFITGSGTNGNIAGVVPADAGNPSVMPAGAIAGETLADGAEGVGLINGYISGVNTSLFAPGDEVFVAVGGGYTNIAPTGSALIQKLGNVEKSHETAGSGVINGPGATRSVPNILPGYSWVGNSDYVATPVATSSFFVTSGSHALTASYVNPLVQDVDITGNLTVTGTVTAQEFHTELVSSSIIYESGSTQFGDTLDDTHTFTGSVNISGSVNADSFTGIFTGALSGSEQIASDISGSFTSVSSSIASDIEDIIDGTTTITSASFASTASYVNTLTQNVGIEGDLTVTGSILLSGSTVNLNVAWPSIGTENHLIHTDGFTISSSFGERTYNYAAIAMEHYEEALNYDHNAFKIYMYDQDGTPEYGTNFLLGPFRAHLNIEASGSNSVANVSVRDFGNGQTQALIYGTEVQLGIYNTEIIGLGNATASIFIESSATEITGSTSISGGLAVNGTLDIKSANVSYQENIDVDFGATEVVATVSSTLYTAAFFDYVIKQGTNLRAGTVTVVHDGTNVEYTEVATQDLGSTTGVTLTCDLSGGEIRLLATTIDDNWSIKAIVRAL